MKKIKIGIALSGGIDSSVAALLLKKNKFYVEGFFMKNWKFFNQTECVNKKDYYYAKKISSILNIRLHILDFSDEYWNFIFLSFLKQLSSGKTPNPDIICNKKIKFNILLFYLLKKFNLDFLSTGHYSKIIKKKNIFFLKEAFDKEKDQTYFLNQINKKIKKKIIFPVSNYSKKEIKKIAILNNLINFNKKDSSGICFIENNKFSKFIIKYLNPSKGNIIYKKNIIGKHKGLFLYTIGQKINISIKNKISQKLYVYKKNFKKNILFVSKNNNKKLFINKCKISNINLFFGRKKTFMCDSKIRHGKIYEKCLIKKTKNSNNYKIIFKRKQKALSVGQYISFYNKDFCLGGALINKIIN